MKPVPPFAASTRTLLLLAALAASAMGSEAAAQEERDLPIASIDSVRVVEWDSGSVTAVFTVRLSRYPDLEDATLEYATESRTAIADSDFVPVSGILHLSTSLHEPYRRTPRSAPASLTYEIPVTVLGDSLIEGNEYFVLRLVAGEGVTIVDSLGTCVIDNDERPRFAMDWMGVPFACGPVAPAFADLDGDGDSDLPTEINLGNAQFTAYDGVIDLLPWGEHHGCAWGDYDKDGLPDLIVMPYDTDWGPGVEAHLLHNLGFGQFENVAPALGMNLVGNGETPVWGDFDGDGWPDLFAPYYAHVPPYRSFFYRNRGDGTFEEKAVDAGIDLSGLPEALKPEGADAVDWDGNGTLDLYCASHLFLNDGTAHFTDVREQVGLPEVFDEGARFVDLDNDGDFDFFLRTAAGPRLFRNQGAHYTEILDSGLPTGPYYWGDSWVDADNDGDLDLLLAVASGTFDLWLNQGTGTFVKDADFATTDALGPLSAWADVDSDGDMDGAVGINSRALLINYTNELPHEPNNVLRVKVLDADSSATSYGAIVRLRELGGGPGSIQTRVVNGGAGYLTQDEYTLHFAGLSSGRYALEVRWPGSPSTATVVDGSVNSQLANLDPRTFPDRLLRVYRNGAVAWGSGAVLAVDTDRPGRQQPSNLLGRPRPMPARSSVQIPLWSADLQKKVELSVRDLAGRRVRAITDHRVGDTSVTWDLRDDHGQPVPSGVYFGRLTVAGQPAGDRRIVVLR